MFWLRNKKYNFQLRTFIWRPVHTQLLLNMTNSPGLTIKELATKREKDNIDLEFLKLVEEEVAIIYMY